MGQKRTLPVVIPLLIAVTAIAIPVVEGFVLNSMKPLPRGSGNVCLIGLAGCGLGLVIAGFSLSQMRGRTQLPRLAILVSSFFALVLNSLGALISGLLWMLSGLPGP